MDALELIDSAAKKVGGISELSRQLEWNKGNIARIKKGGAPLPPYRAAQLARLLGRDEKAAYLAALAAQSDGAERSFWLGELRQRGAAITGMLTLLVILSLAAFQTQKVLNNGISPIESGIYIMNNTRPVPNEDERDDWHRLKLAELFGQLEQPPTKLVR